MFQWSMALNKERRRMMGNQIKSLSGKIFAYNLHLEFIDLYSNKVKTIDPQVSSNLKQLKVI
jgi:hypothetical protein